MESISEKLRQNGFRVTGQRQKILDSLMPFPQSVAEIYSSLNKKGISVDMATIYRTLDCFIYLGIVGETHFKDKISKYELISINYHHHHLICDKCGSIEDIPLDDKFLVDEVNKHTNFKVKSHALEFFGICGKCQGA